MKTTIIKILSFIPIISMCIYIYYLRFSNPDMTSTKFFITYWKQELTILVIGILSSIVYGLAEAKDKKEMNKMIEELGIHRHRK